MGRMAVKASSSEQPTIRRTPNVVGGSARIRDTRIAVWLLAGYRNLGRSDAELLEYYPSLSQSDLDAAWEYYRAHRREVDRDIRANDDDARD